MLLSVVLVYFGVALFLFLTLRNKKPVKWSQIFDAITFRANITEDIYNVPGPLRLPIIGSTWLKLFNPSNKLHKYYEELNRKYGDIVLESFGNINAVSIFKRQEIEKVLKYPSKSPFRPPVEIVCKYRLSKPERYASVGISNANGPEWNFLRSKMTSKTLENKKMLSQLFPVQNEICDDFISEIKSCRNSENNIEKFEDISRLFAFESSSSFIVGQRMGAFGNVNTPNKDLAIELADISREMFQIFEESYYGNQMWKYFPTQLYKRYAKAEEATHRIAKKIILNLKKEGLRDNGSPMSTILHAEGLDERDKVVGVVDFFVSGIDIVSTAMLILIGYLSKNPQIQEKIYEESKHFGEKINYEELSAANYTRAVITECFRLCPSAFAITRILEEDTDLLGYRLKAGTLTILHTYAACQKEENFENAQQFIPERWINDEGKFDSTLCPGSPLCIPFGTGKRMCPGKKFAEHLMIFSLIKLVKAFEIKYDGELEKVFDFFLKLKCPPEIKFSDRIQS